MLKLSRRQIDHEDVVAEGYAALRRAALYLARGDEAEAGDLLHDTFVRFLLLRPNIDAIGNLDGYLYTMLRNVYLSRQRRHVRRRAVVTETSDVALLAVMVDEPEPDERLRMRGDLTRLVDHARDRTRVSRAASAWILRCVHGYYPAEIARLMKMPPRAVDRALHVARREALEELGKPVPRGRANDGGGQRWRDLFVDPRGSAARGDDRDADGGDPLDTLQVLRARLFSCVDGACLTDSAIAELYRPAADSGPGADGGPGSGSDSGSRSGSRSGSGSRSASESRSRAAADADEASAPAGTLLMAHVVACASCLDRINHHLDLPPLKMRDPVESSGTRRPRRDGGSNGSGESGGSSGSSDPDGSGNTGGSIVGGPVHHHGERKGGSASRGGAGLDPLLRRTRDTIASIVNHVPRELRIAANGLELGALPVSGAVTVQELAVRLAESLAFVEVFDERGALVCYWPAQVPRDGVLDDDITIELPDGRSIELRVSLMDDCPRLRVRYTDARLGAAAAVALREVHRAPQTTIDEAEPQRLRWWERLVPSPRFAVVAGAVVVLWMILIGPATTWAALGHLGRAAVEAIRTLMTSKPPVTQPVATPAAPPAATASPAAIAPPRAKATARIFSPSELTELEMAIRVALHGVQADLGEDITLRATPGGVAVQGVVGGAARRDSIARAIAGLEGARMSVRIADELSTRARTSGIRRTKVIDASRLTRSGDDSASPAATAVGAATGAAAAGTAAMPAVAGAGESPVFANALQEALADRLPAPADRAAFVNDTLARADEALARAWALRRLAERYQPSDVTALSDRASQSLATLVGDHTTTLRTAVDALIARVTPLVAAAEAKAEGKADGKDAATRGAAALGDAARGDAAADASSTSRASREPRLSTMELFTLVNAWHEDAHALLAGARVTMLSDAPRPNAREWLTRLHRIQDALKQPPSIGH